MSYGYFRKPDMPETAKIDKSKNQFDSFSDRGYVSTDEEGNPVVLDYDSFLVTGHGKVIELPQKEFLLLYKLLSNPNKIFTKIQAIGLSHWL